MKKYFAIVQCRAAALLQYRSATFATLANQIFWGMIKVMLFTALFSQTRTPQPLSLSQVVSFIWLSQATVTLLPWDVDEEIEELVKSGNITSSLIQPVDIYWLFFSRCMAMRFIRTIISGAFVITIAVFFCGLSAPVSIASGIAWVGSVVLATLLSSAMTTLVLITLFWTLAGEGLKRVLPYLCLIFTGTSIPLPLFPDWVQPFLNVQPLRGLMDIPSKIYTGIIPLSSLSSYYLFQVVWIFLFVAFGRYLMGRALRRVEIHGG